MRHFTRPLCHCSPPPGTSRNSLANACPQSRAPLPEPLSPPCPEHSRRLAALLLPGCGDSTDRDATPKTFLPYVRRFSRRASEDERARKSRDPLSRRYRDALAAVPAMRGQAAAKPAHIGQKVRRGRRRVPETAPDAPRAGSMPAGWGKALSWWTTERVVRRFPARFPPS